MIRVLSFYFLFLVAIFLGLILLGMINGYSPVPYYDMWDGYLGNYLDIEKNKNMATWLSFHNEHRIVFSRLLFWIDIKYFNGLSKFLLPMNFLLLVFFVSIVIFSLRELDFKKSAGLDGEIAIFAFLSLLGLSWMQSDNLVWGFQSQFIAVYLFPFISFYSFYLFFKTKQVCWLVVTVVFGLLSPLTMANGVAVFPILLLLGLLYRLDSRYIVLMLLLSTMVLGLYFVGYENKSGLGNLSEVFHNIATIKTFILFILAYLGNPMSLLLVTGAEFLSVKLPREGLGIAFGLLFIVINLLSFIYILKIDKSKFKNFLYVYFAFIFFVGGAALATGIGRSSFGLDYAFQNRYTTPMLFSWLLLIAILLHIIRSKLTHSVIWVGFVIISILLMSVQVSTVDNKDVTLYERKVAALALELGIRDEKYLYKLFPFMDQLELISREAKKQELSIFSHKDINALSELILKENPYKIFLTDSKYKVRAVKFLSTDNDYSYISGWYSADSLSSRLMFVDPDNNKIVGFALTIREDKKDGVYENGYRFDGYVKNNYRGSLYLVDMSSKKGTFLQIDNYKGIKFKFKSTLKLVKSKALKFSHIDQLVINKVNTFKSDAVYNLVPIPGFQIFGSRVTGDAYTGSVSLNLNKNSWLLFKTGPVTKNQILSIYSKSDKGISLIKSIKLPFSEKWSAMKLIGKEFPNTVLLTLSDMGSAWGEWSGIALEDMNVHRAEQK